MREIINFNTQFESLEKINPLITKFRINICQADKPANGFVFSKEVIEGMSNTIRGAGVYAYYFEKENQLGGHESNEVRTKYGKRRTGTPIAYGFSDPYVAPYWMMKDGQEWYTADVYLWTARNPELEEVLQYPVYQSMEVALDDEVLPNGNRKVKEAIFLGFCLLQGIEPAFDGSKIEKFSLPVSEVDKLKQEYDSFSSKYDVLDFSIPDNIKDATKLGLELYKKYNKGGTSVALANARFIQKNDKVTPQKVKNIAKYFSRIEGKEISDKDESNEDWITLCLWGGCEASSWSTKLQNEIKEIDKQHLSIFKKEVENVIVEAVNKFSLTSHQIEQILSNALSEFKYGEHEWQKYWVRTYDDELVYVHDCEDDKNYSFKYTISDLVATVDMESKDEVIDGGFISVSKKEEMDMSANANVDAVAMQELNEKAAEANKKLAEQAVMMEEKDKEIESLKEEMADKAECMSKLEEQVAALTKFKNDIETQNKNFAIDAVLNEVTGVLPEEEIKNFRTSAENFTFENIGSWENEVRAKAFKFSKGIPETKGFTRIAIPVSTPPKKSNGLWD